MRSEFIVAALTVLMIAVRPCPAQNAPPMVAVTQPRNGDEAVSANLREIVVTFDQDMDRTGASFMGGGATFPKVTGKPWWRSARECVLPVQVESGRAYTIGINRATHGNFRSAAGVSATPVVFHFTVRATGVGPQDSATDSATQAESLRQLRDAIEHRYSYRDVCAVDWAATWKLFEPRLLAARTPREFAVVAGEMLSLTKDAHIWLTEGGALLPAFRRDATPNASLKLLPSLIGGWNPKHPMVAAGRAAPGVGYIAIHSWEKKHAPQLVDAAVAALAELRGEPALVLDVRFNSGGDETLAREFASCFVREPKLYARHVMVDPSGANGFSAPVDRWIEPSAKRPTYAGRVAVLMGPVNMSSAEAFLLMMKQAGCQLIGARSYGASGNPQPHTLANGVTAMLPSWKAMLPDGSEFERKGLAPDVAVAAKPGDFAERDPVLEKALEVLTK